MELIDSSMDRQLIDTWIDRREKIDEVYKYLYGQSGQVNGQTEGGRWIDRCIGKQRQENRQTDKQVNRQWDRQIDRYIGKQIDKDMEIQTRYKQIDGNIPK